MSVLARNHALTSAHIEARAEMAKQRGKGKVKDRQSELVIEDEPDRGHSENKKEPKKSRKGAEKEPKRSRKRELKDGAEIRKDILQCMQENPAITQLKLMEEFELTRKQVQIIIKDLQMNGFVERQGSNRSGKWVVKKEV